MSSTSSMFRLLFLIRRLTKPYTYPTKEQLLEGLHQRGLATSPRTLERDFQVLTNTYSLLVKYDRYHGGYWGHLPEDEDIEDFQTFLALLERKERLGFLTGSHQALLQASRLLLDHQADFPGNHQGTLWKFRKEGGTVYGFKDEEDTAELGQGHIKDYTTILLNSEENLPSSRVIIEPSQAAYTKSVGLQLGKGGSTVFAPEELHEVDGKIEYLEETYPTHLKRIYQQKAVRTAAMSALDRLSLQPEPMAQEP